MFWTDYVATRWYRAPELCGSFFTKYTPAIDVWSIGCIFAEILSGRPLFPGKNVVHQLEIITDLLGTPTPEQIAKVRNEKARRFLANMRVKPKIPFQVRFPKAAPEALLLLERLLAFDPDERPTAEEALADPYFNGLADSQREPAATPISRVEYAFESKKLTQEEVRELLYYEILEYHPQAKREYEGQEKASNFAYPSAVDNIRNRFAAAEEAQEEGKGERDEGGGKKAKALRRSSQSLPKEHVDKYREEAQKFVSGQGALQRSDSINVTTPVVGAADIDEMLEVVDSMSLDDKTAAEVAQHAARIAAANGVATKRDASSRQE